MSIFVIIRGGGDLASGVALRLHRSGIDTVITELAQPLAVRRTVAFSEAVYEGKWTLEGINASCVQNPENLGQIQALLSDNIIPVIVDPECQSAALLQPAVLVDARMLKVPPQPLGYTPSLFIGLGPGFTPGKNCDVAIETRRSHYLGRGYTTHPVQPDTGLPDGNPERVLRAPLAGKFVSLVEIGQYVNKGQVVARIESNPNNHNSARSPIHASLSGVLRGLLRTNTMVLKDQKVGDIDPKGDHACCTFASDKALAIGGGVLEAILSFHEFRSKLWS